MTEHTDTLTKETAAAFVAECEKLSDASFIFIPGFEVPYKDAHILHVGATNFVSDFADEEQLHQWRENTELVILAHPVRNKFIVDKTMLEVLDGVEVWNQQYEGKRVPRPRSLKLLKELRAEKSLLATGGLDFHRREHFGSPVISIEVESFSEDTVLNALKAGRFSFGSDEVQISATEDWQPSPAEQWQSFRSVVVISGGKFINKTLAQLGLTLPAKLKTSVRSRV